MAAEGLRPAASFRAVALGVVHAMRDIVFIRANNFRESAALTKALEMR